jgi:hypothetical protein
MKDIKEIVFVAPHCCIRVIKEAFALRELGYEIHLIWGGNIIGPLTSPDAMFMHTFKTISYFANNEQLEEEILHCSKNTLVFHVHNEPTWPVTKVRELVPDAKIVFDVHDSKYWMFDDDHYAEEDTAINFADAFIVPSDACKKDFTKRTDKPIVVLPPAVPYRWYRDGQEKPLGGLASQGGHTSSGLSHRTYRDYTELYSALKGFIEVYAYSAEFGTSGHPAIIQNTKYYSELGCKMANISYGNLLSSLGNHDWNLVGNYSKEPQKIYQYWHPNKFYDAIAAGIPSVVFNAPEVEKIVLENDIGIVCRTPAEFIKRKGEYKEKRHNLMMKRKRFSMENYIHVVDELYQSIGTRNEHK